MKPIIDVSYYNIVTDWNKVRDAVEGVIIRMGYTGYGSGKIVYDSKYREYRAACERLEIPHSFYYFPQSINDEEAMKEADFIISELQTAGELLTPVWLDSERAEANGNGRGDKLTRAQRTWFLKLIARKVTDAGFPCGIYASRSWLENQLNMNDLKDFPVWCAQYNSVCTYGGRYDLWQFSSKYTIPGITKPVDASVRHDVPADNTDKPISSELDAAITIIALNVIQGYFGKGHEARSANIYKLVRDKVNVLC